MSVAHCNSSLTYNQKPIRKQAYTIQFKINQKLKNRDQIILFYFLSENWTLTKIMCLKISLSKAFTMFKEKSKKEPLYVLLWIHHYFCKHNQHTSSKTNKTHRFKNIWTLSGAKKHIYKK
jgi:hypothetical protein